MSNAPSNFLLQRLGSFSEAAILARRFGQLSYLAFNLPSHLRYMKETVGYSEYETFGKSLRRRHRYLGDYMARSLSRASRRSIILTHHRLIKNIEQSLNKRITNRGIHIWERTNCHNSTIILTNSRLAPMEGEWQLQFILNDKPICTLSLSFALLNKSPHFDRYVCLIGGLQGGYNCRQEMRIAAKENHEISPVTMLIIAAKAVSQALDVSAVFGVSSEEQVSSRYANEQIKVDYNTMWKTEGSSFQVDGFHALSEGLVHRDLSDIPLSHRRRAKQKRARKAEIFDAIVTTAQAEFQRIV